MEFLCIMKIWKCWYLFHNANVCSFLSGNTRLQHMQIVTLVDITRVVVVIFLDSKITADGDCSHEIKRCLLLAKKTMTNLDSGDISLLPKVFIVKAMVFPVVMYRCESWTIKKAEYRRIDTFELWCWRRLLRVSWTARRWNQSVLKEINPEYSLEGLMLRLKL